MSLVHGKQIVTARTLLGLSQMDLAELAAIDLAAVHELEGGEEPKAEYAQLEAALVSLGIEFSQDQSSFGVRIARVVDGLAVSDFIKARKALRDREAGRIVQGESRTSATATRVAVLGLFDEFRAGRSFRSTITRFLESETLAKFEKECAGPLRLSSRTVRRWLMARGKRGEAGLVRQYSGGQTGWYDTDPVMRQALITMASGDGMVRAADISRAMKHRFPEAAVGLEPRAINRALAALVTSGAIGQLRRPRK